MATFGRQRLCSLLVLVGSAQLIPRFVSSQTSTYICNNTGVDFVLRANSRYCYRLWQADENFIEANKTCSRNNAALVRIDSQEENDYINETYFVQLGYQEFWIGLSDIVEEGVFRWTDGSSLSYNGWATDSPVDNEKSYDCVKFTVDGWRVEEGFCATSELPFLCRQNACNTTDGQTCIDTSLQVTGVSPAVVTVSVLVPLIVIAVVVVGIVLLIVAYKCYNDFFYKYLCCCLYRASQLKVTTMQQEIQQLRHQLSQQKLSFSGRYQPGEFKKQLSQGNMAPTDPGSPQRIVAQPAWGQFPSRVSPMRSPSVVSGTPSLMNMYGLQPRPPIQHSLSASTSGYLPFKARPSLPAIKEKQTPVTENPVKQLQEKTHHESSDESESSSSEDAASTKIGPTKDKQGEE